MPPPTMTIWAWVGRGADAAPDELLELDTMLEPLDSE
jgi:hypothetical protein